MNKVKLRPTHLPIIKALQVLYPEADVLESGGGDYSTGAWLEKCRHLTTIEYDTVWSKYITDKYSGYKNHAVISIPVPGVTRCMYPDQLEDCLKGACMRAALDARRLSGASYDIIMIDSFASTRMYELCVFMPDAPVIMVHDTENKRYKMEDSFERYYDKFLRRIDCIPASGPNTTVWFKSLIDSELFIKEIKCIAENYNIVVRKTCLT